MKLLLKLSCFALALTLSATSLTGCGQTNTATPGKGAKLSVYTSFYPMYDFAKNIGGDKINLTNLIPAGTEPHDWEPSPADIVHLEKADILIYNGAGMESWVDQVLSSLDNKKLIAVEAAKGLPLLKNTDPDENLAQDPHVWLNPENAKKEAEAIKDAFVQADPANKTYYEQNYTGYAQKLDALDQEYKAAAKTFKQKNIVVSHQAFGYLCQAYGLNQVPIEGLNADSEPSSAKMAEIADFVKKNKVKYIFFEELVSPKTAEALATETGAQTAVLNPLEGMSDQELQAGKDYLSVMEDNLATLKKALD